MRIIDLSVPLDNDGSWAPWWARNKVSRHSHAAGRRAIRLVFGVPARLLKTGLGWANDTIKLSTHGTTHIDAPWHYGPESEGQPAKTIDQVPLEWCYGPGVVLDVRHRGDGEEITTDDLQQALAKIPHTLTAGDIVLIYTGSDRLLGKPEYFTQGPGVGAEATRWLLDQGVKLVGIDAWGWDGPLATQAARARKENRDGVFWAAHYVGVEKEYCQIERLMNLDALPPVGFKLCAFPLKVAGGSAGPARVVAILDE